MLKGKLKITLEGRNYIAHEHFRLAFSFGKDLIFTGSVGSEHSAYLQGETYTVDVKFFTVTPEAYSILKPILKSGLDLVICEENV